MKKLVMCSRDKQQNLMEYGLIIALYYVTGGAFSYTNYSFQISFFCLIAFGLCWLKGKQRLFLEKKVFLVWCVMSFFVLLVPLIWSDSIPTYLAIIMQLSIGMFCAAIIPVNNFKGKYIKVIVFFAAISLMGFMLGNIYPQIAQLFPKSTVVDADVYYYNAGIYVFMQVKGYSSMILMSRNAGICWEPGCYQMFLNVGLLFLLDGENDEHQNYFWVYFIILVTTIITTVSTTGIILMVIILMIYFRTWGRGLGKAWICMPLFLIILNSLLSKMSIYDFLGNKLAREFGENAGFLERISLNRLQYTVSEEGVPYLLGMSFGRYSAAYPELWNSIIHALLCLGIPFTFIQLLGYWRGGKVLVKKKYILFLLMVMCASTETLFWRVFFDTIAFYGWIYGCDRKTGI